MPFNLFMAVCILGCDVLIYFLFQWTLGEKSRTKRRRMGARRRITSGQETELVVVPAKKIPARQAKILQYAKFATKKQLLPRNESWQTGQMDEATAYRRRAAALASPKHNAKLAV